MQYCQYLSAKSELKQDEKYMARRSRNAIRGHTFARVKKTSGVMLPLFAIGISAERISLTQVVCSSMGVMVDTIAILSGPDAAVRVRGFFDKVSDLLAKFLGVAGSLGLKDVIGEMGMDGINPFISIEATSAVDPYMLSSQADWLAGLLTLTEGYKAKIKLAADAFSIYAGDAHLAHHCPAALCFFASASLPLCCSPTAKMHR